MDAKQFDDLVKRLGGGPSRRDTLKGLAAGALSVFGLAEGTLSKGKSSRKKGGKGKGKGKGHGPVPNSRRCDCPGGRGGKKKKKGKGKGLAPCGRCESGFFTRQPNGNCHCACRPDTTACDSARPFQCCSGICTNGQCAPYGS